MSSRSGRSPRTPRSTRSEEGARTPSSVGSSGGRRGRAAAGEGGAFTSASASERDAGRGTPIRNPRRLHAPTSAPRGDVGEAIGAHLSTPSSYFGTPSSRGPGSVSSGGGDGGRLTEDDVGGGMSELESTEMTEGLGSAVVYGTTIRVDAVERTFREFLEHFHPESCRTREEWQRSRAEVRARKSGRGGGRRRRAGRSVSSVGEGEEGEGVAGSGGAEGAGIGLYLGALREMAETGALHLTVDCQEVYLWSAAGRELYEWLLRYPQEVIPVFDLVATALFQREKAALAVEESLTESGEDGGAVRVRVRHLRKHIQMRELDPRDVDMLVSVRGMVTRASDVIPDLTLALFRCGNCGFEPEPIPVVRGRVEEPALCSNCETRHSLALVHNRSLFKDKQAVRLQETPESIPPGETPHTVVLYLHEDLVDTALPGDRVQVTGIFRAIPSRVNPRRRQERSVFRTFLDVVHVEKLERGRLAAEVAPEAGSSFDADFAPAGAWDPARDSAEMLAQRKTRVERLAADPELYPKLAASLAPSIWEMEDVKKGLLLQLFGGVNKDMGDHGKARGEVNVLLCGDPGTSKSQLLGYVNKVAPRGIYTSGKGSSAVGLTAYVTKDPETREPVLESGALVLSDRGVCCIDEFDKMSDTTRSILHEVMEQQTVSVAKAGIICTLNARTSVLASANPVESRYNPRLSVVENIQLPPALLSRFDLIYLVLDHADPAHDRALARHLVSLYFDPKTRAPPRAPVPPALLTEYIAYARAHVHPSLSDAAAKKLVEAYTEMRGRGAAAGAANGKKVIAATPRQLASLVRLAEAHARMRLAAQVEPADVAEALRLVNVATQKAAMDPTTGEIDMDMLHTGRTALGRDTVGLLKEAVKLVADAMGRHRRLHRNELEKRLERDSDVHIAPADLEQALVALSAEDAEAIAYDPRSRTITFNP